MKLLLTFIFLLVFRESSQFQYACISPLDHKGVGNFNFLDGKFFSGDSLKHEELYYDKLISFKIFFKNSEKLWYQFLRIDDTSFLETKYFSNGKMEEKIRYTILDSVFSTDTAALMNIEGDILRDTLVFDTIINLVRDGRANFYDSLGFALYKNYSMGKETHEEMYWNYEIGYGMWSILKNWPQDTVFVNEIFLNKPNYIRDQLLKKRWSSCDGDFMSLKDIIRFFYYENESCQEEIFLDQNSSGNDATIFIRGVDDERKIQGTWELHSNTQLILEFPSIKLEFLILYLDQHHMILKTLSNQKE